MSNVEGTCKILKLATVGGYSLADIKHLLR